MRDSFIFYRSFFETITKISKKDRLQLVEAICDYALNDIEPGNLSGTCDAVFTLLKPQLDANTRKYENGLKGGRPKKPNNNLNRNLTETKPKRNDNDNVNDNVNDNDNGNDKTSPSFIIKYLNTKTGADYDPDDPDIMQYVSDLIDKGYSYDDITVVINKKCSEWLNDSVMRSYLRPSTLFGSKFAEYLAAPESIRAETERKKSDELKEAKKQLSAKRKQLERIRSDLEDPELIEESRVNIRSRFYDLRDKEAILEDNIQRLEARVSALGG